MWWKLVATTVQWRVCVERDVLRGQSLLTVKELQIKKTDLRIVRKSFK